jgi:Lipocalin-like domain
MLSALPLGADIAERKRHVRKVPISDSARAAYRGKVCPVRLRSMQFGARFFRFTKGVTMRNLFLALTAITFSVGSAFADDDFPGTYKLVSGTRTVVETGEIKDAYGKNPKGYIMYGQDGRMLTLITHDGRSKPSRSRHDRPGSSRPVPHAEHIRRHIYIPW